MHARKVARKALRKWTKTKTLSKAAKGLENLENRQLFATLDVAQFGAVANDGRDDTAAIRAALNASRPGDTVLFNGGTYNVSDLLILGSDRTIEGRNGATIKASGIRYTFGFQGNGQNMTITGMKLDGAGIKGDGPGVYKNITITNNEIFNYNTGGVGGAIYINYRNENTRIANNIFRDATASWGIQMYYSDRLTIERNTFHNLMQGAHLLNIYNDSKILYNKLTGLQRMGFEIQDLNWTQDAPMRNLLVEGNVLYGWRNIYHESFGLSVVRQNSINTRVINNYIRIDGTVRPGIGLEFSARTDGASEGNQSIVSGNTIIGNWFGFVAHYWPEQRVQNNKFFGVSWNNIGYVLAWRGHGGTPNNNQAINNSINTSTAAAPGIPTNVGAGSSGTWGTPTTPAPTPTPTPTPTPPPQAPAPSPSQPTSNRPEKPTALVAQAMSPTSVKLQWNDNANNETAYRIEMSTNGRDFVRIAQLGANSTSYKVDGLRAGRTYTFRVRALNGSTGSSYSNTQTVKPTVTDGRRVTFVSDLQPIRVENGWGGIERDRANGEIPTGDGTVMSIMGKRFAKGIGVHSNSKVVYRLHGKYDTFMASVGVDDKVGANGSVQFQVWGDGVRLWQSRVMTGRDAAINARVDVSGVQQLMLRVLDARDGKDYDHANWGNARLLRAVVNVTGRPGATTPNPGRPVFLSDIQWVSARAKGGNVTNDGALAAGDDAVEPMRLNGVKFDRGLGVSAHSEVKYALNGSFKMFRAEIGTDDAAPDAAKVIFRVFGDGKKLFDSGIMSASDVRAIAVNVDGVRELRLTVTNATGKSYVAAANWANARLAA
jgi:hypothetical protein